MWILSSSVQLDISRVRYRIEHEKIKFISTSGHVIFCLLYKHRINSCEKGAIYYVTITTVISSRLKITCYLHVWRYEVFAGKLAWYFTGVYIINCYSLHPKCGLSALATELRRSWHSIVDLREACIRLRQQPNENTLVDWLKIVKFHRKIIGLHHCKTSILIPSC